MSNFLINFSTIGNALSSIKHTVTQKVSSKNLKFMCREALKDIYHATQKLLSEAKGDGDLITSKILEMKNTVSQIDFQKTDLSTLNETIKKLKKIWITIGILSLSQIEKENTREANLIKILNLIEKGKASELELKNYDTAIMDHIKEGGLDPPEIKALIDMGYNFPALKSSDLFYGFHNLDMIKFLIAVGVPPPKDFLERAEQEKSHKFQTLLKALDVVNDEFEKMIKEEILKILSENQYGSADIDGLIMGYVSELKQIIDTQNFREETIANLPTTFRSSDINNLISHYAARANPITDNRDLRIAFFERCLARMDNNGI